MASCKYAVRMTNTNYEVLGPAQLDRDRADTQNAFDELNNQSGWGGLPTHDPHRCRLAAWGVALAYNWWSLFVRLAHPDARCQAITSRPGLMAGAPNRQAAYLRASQAHPRQYRPAPIASLD
jgi:hypothetical protein